ncbi:MAG: ACT domain-containing protein [Candidatus Dactylopiibacterium sp.]|nr:ACT domain-containing protein [Candidatus Dactylopiibacterium sp.]
MPRPLRLLRLPGPYAVARLAPHDAIPPWADGEGFVSISRTRGETSVTCLQARVPADVRHTGGWVALELLGPFAFDESGILLRLIEPVSRAGIGVFVVSTYDSDHLLLQGERFDEARRLLEAAGHALLDAAPPSA